MSAAQLIAWCISLLLVLWVAPDIAVAWRGARHRTGFRHVVVVAAMLLWLLWGTLQQVALMLAQA